MTPTQPKVALVTGGSRGIGRAITEKLAAQGYAVAIAYASNEAAAAEVVAAVEATGGQIMAVRADIGKLADITHLFEEVLGRFGRLDVLVNNAGLAVFKPLPDITEADYDASFAVNAKGTFFVTQHALKHLADGGRIISITTGGVSGGGSPGGTVYLGSKAAAQHYVQSLAKEVGARGITVNAVAPGMTDTDMLAGNPQFKEMAASMSPLGRLGQPEDVADVVVFLASEQGRWLTGQVLQAGGGVVI
jgi:3-oxoacyl-[acyl-carrier protein] reductase